MTFVQYMSPMKAFGRCIWAEGEAISTKGTDNACNSANLTGTRAVE